MNIPVDPLRVSRPSQDVGLSVLQVLLAAGTARPDEGIFHTNAIRLFFYSVSCVDETKSKIETHLQHRHLWPRSALRELDEARVGA